MNREELLALLAIIIRVHGDNDKLLCSKAVYEGLGDELQIENHRLENGDIELLLTEGE